MKLAFCLFRYFPHGGLQRDFFRMVEICAARGHLVDVYAAAWEVEAPRGAKLEILPRRGLSNHRMMANFSRALQAAVSRKRYDAVVGFNKTAGLDVYFAGDTSFAARADSRRLWYRLTPRYRTFLRLEGAVFGPRSRARILLLSEREKAFYMSYYGTHESRFHLLPPGIELQRIASAPERAEARVALGVGDDRLLVLMVGSGFRTKGVDRALRALDALPGFLRARTLLFVVGRGKAAPLERWARRRGLGDQVRFFGGRDDVPRFLKAADLLLHPARQETAGMVLIEAMAAGLPVLVTEVCGYAEHVERAGAGLLIPDPFRQDRLNEMLAQMLEALGTEAWGERGTAYVASTDVTGLHERAADVIEEVASQKSGPGDGKEEEP
ncbi:MAG: glycosyltransferase family 4 protein [Deltaproteobacteria bacterium]|nr:glycosyltransferase family 4 protein [Deltaproteobacteria bacterium]